MYDSYFFQVPLISGRQDYVIPLALYINARAVRSVVTAGPLQQAKKLL